MTSYYQDKARGLLEYQRALAGFWRAMAANYSTQIDLLDWQQSLAQDSDVEWISQDHVTLCCLHAEALEKAKHYETAAEATSLELTRLVSPEAYVQLMSASHALTSTQELEA